MPKERAKMAIEKVSKEVRHKCADRFKGKFICFRCGQSTCNIPLYQFTLCPAKDRRKGKAERRTNDLGLTYDI
jgi:hypothetical protein